MTDLIFVWVVILMHQSLPHVFQPAAVQEEDEKKKKAESVSHGLTLLPPNPPPQGLNAACSAK